MRIRFLSVLAALTCGVVLAMTAHAQRTPPGLQPLPEPPPPPPNAFDNVEPAQVTVRQQDGDTIEEYRVGGRVVAIKVARARGAPYVLTGPRGDGSFSQRRYTLEVRRSV